MSPFGRISASLLLTLVVWSPTALGALQGTSVDATTAALRFLIIFTFARLAMRGIDRMLHVYKDANGSNAAKGSMPVEATAVLDAELEAIALARRRTDGLTDPIDGLFGETEPVVETDVDRGLATDADLNAGGALVPSRLDEVSREGR